MSNYDYITDALTNNVDDDLEIASEQMLTLTGNKDRVQYKLTGTKLDPRIKIMCPGAPGMHQKPDGTRLIFSSDDNIIFRLYITEITELDNPKYQNRFVRLLRQLDEHKTLHIHMGSEVYGAFPVYSFGNIIDAIQRASCKVVTHINGRAGFSETSMWLFGHERFISEFGVLYFTGLENALKWSPEWRPYFEVFLNKAKELKILTPKEVSELLTSNRAYRFTYTDVVSRINAPANEEED